MLNASYPSIVELKCFLSEARFKRYEDAVLGRSGVSAACLYDWNANVASKLMLPAQYAEISIRNAANEALIAEFGEDWISSARFIQSLPNPSGRVFSPRKELLKVKDMLGSASTTGKVVAELKMAFWEKLFTRRHDSILWNNYLFMVFPCAPSESVSSVRNDIRASIEQIRDIRNRIAHCEPIFHYDLAEELSVMLELIRWRSSSVHAWVSGMEEVTDLLAQRPI